METALQSDPQYLKQFTFVLAIKQFNMCVNQKCISSEYFVADVLFETKWRLHVYPRGKTEKDSKFISCFLSRADKDEGPKNITIRLTMGLIDKDSKELETRVLKDNKFLKNSTYGFGHFLVLETLFKVKDYILPKNTLTIFCRMEMLGLKKTRDSFTAKYVGYKRNKFRWPVQAFNKCSENEKKTTIVQFDPEPKTQFEISFHVAERIVNIDIRRFGESVTELCEARCTITVISSEEDFIEFSEEGHHSFKKDPGDVWVFPTFLKIDDLNPKLLSGDILTLMCDFTIDTSNEEARIEEIAFADWELPPLDTTRISQYRNMECLFDTEDHSDVELSPICDSPIDESIDTLSLANWKLPPLDTTEISLHTLPHMKCLLLSKNHSDEELGGGEHVIVSTKNIFLQSRSPVEENARERQRHSQGNSNGDAAFRIHEKTGSACGIPHAREAVLRSMQIPDVYPKARVFLPDGTIYELAEYVRSSGRRPYPLGHVTTEESNRPDINILLDRLVERMGELDPHKDGSDQSDEADFQEKKFDS